MNSYVSFDAQERLRGRGPVVPVPTTPGGYRPFDEVEQEAAVNPNIGTSLIAGFVRGVTQPFALLPAVSETSNRMKQFYGVTNPTKISYGLGYIAGTLLPVTLHYKLANLAIRGIGGAFVAADKAADLTRLGRLAVGSIAGALYGMGQQADDLNDAFKNVGVNAVIGGAADVVLPAAWSALSSRFGSKTNSKIDDVLNSTLDRVDPLVPGEAIITPPPKVKVETEGVRAHARAMQLLSDLDNLTKPYQAESIGAGSGVDYSLTIKQTQDRNYWTNAFLDKLTIPESGPLRTAYDSYTVGIFGADYSGSYGAMRQQLGALTEQFPDYQRKFRAELDKLFPDQETVTLYKIAPADGSGLRGEYGNGTMTYKLTDVFKWKGSSGITSTIYKGETPATIWEITVPKSSIVAPGALEEAELIFKIKDATIKDVGLELQQAAALAEQAGDVTIASKVQPMADRRAALEAGVQKMTLEDLLPGEIRAVPTPHDDGVILGKLFDAVEGLDNVVVPGKDPHVLVSLKGSASLTNAAKDIAKQGFARGQKALYKGQEYIAVKPTAGGDKVHLTQPGRLKKPIVADKSAVQFLPSIQDMVTGGLKRQPGVLANDFITGNTLWPDQGIEAAFNAFAKARNLNPSERLATMDQLMRLQRGVIEAEEPAMVHTLRALDQDVAKLSGKVHPDGPIDELASQKGLVPIQKFINGEWHYILKDARGQAVSPPLPSRAHTIEWLHNYAVIPGNVIDAVSPLADNVIPGGGVPSVPAHTAGEMSSYSFNPALNLFARLMPNSMYLKFAEDKLTQLAAKNAAGEAIRPYTRVFLKLSKNKLNYYNAIRTQLKGGMDAGKKVVGLLNIFKPDSKAVRLTAKEDVLDLIEKPLDQWSNASKGLTASEVNVGRQLRTQWEEWINKYIRDADITTSAQEIIEDYLPSFRRLSNTEAPKSVKMILGMKGKEVNKATLDFLGDMFRSGEMKKWDRDPFAVSLNILRSGLYKTHLKSTIDDAMEHVRSIPETTGDLVALKKQLINYMHLASYGAPDAFSNVNLAFKGIMSRLGVHIPDEARDRLINSFMAMNYSAYLGFRPGLVIRNFSQTLLTTYPLLGGKYTAYGLRTITANKKAAYDEMRRVGVFMSEHVPVPGEDLYFAELADQSFRAQGLLSKAGRAAKAVGEYGMAWFNTADKINRGVAYFGQKRKTLDAWTLFSEGKFNEEKFLSKSGLNYFGDSVKGEFNRIRAAQGIESAAEFLGSIAASDTQWIYQMGAGPALFSHGIGRLMGQYGTWPMWYGSYIAQGLKNLKGMDRVMFVARNVAMHKTIVGVGALAGFNLSRWTGLSSLSWMGGPVVDWFADLRDIVTGVQTGGEPTANRQIALARYGAKDTGNVEGVSMLPAWLGGRIAINDPGRFAMSFFSTVTPGYLALKDVQNAMTSPDALSAAAAVFNLPLKSAGNEWPEMH